MRQMPILAAPLLLFISVSACTPTAPEDERRCEDGVRFEEACPGLPAAPICDRGACTDGVACAAVHDVGSSEELAAAAATAGSGDCLALAPGDYPAVVLPAGVSLLGSGAGAVTVAGVTAGGGAVTLRGITVTDEGIYADGGDLLVDRVRITGTSRPGIHVVDASLSVVDATIDDNAGYGIAAMCSGGCACARPPEVVLTRVAVHGNQEVGVWLHGVSARLRGVDVGDTGPRNFQRGRGIEASGCSEVDGRNLTVRDHPDVGLFLHRAGAALGPDLQVTRNLRGMQIQSLDDGLEVVVDGFDVVDNRGVGIGADGAVGIILQNGRVAGTSLADLPVDFGGSEGIGDGLSWLGGSVLTVERSVSVGESARLPVVIDGSTEGRFEGSLTGGDETVGIILQNYDPEESGLFIEDGLQTSSPDDPFAVAAPLDSLEAP